MFQLIEIDDHSQNQKSTFSIRCVFFLWTVMSEWAIEGMYEHDCVRGSKSRMWVESRQVSKLGVMGKIFGVP